MNISKRLFTYPVLSEEKKDYNSSVFDIDFNYGINDMQSIYLELNVILQNAEILQQVYLGNAQIYLHVECSSSGFRKMFELSNGVNWIEVEINKIIGKIELVGLVLAKENIENFVSSDFQEDFQNISFNLKKGSILAYKNINHLKISKQIEEFKNTESIIVIRKLSTEDEVPMKVEMENQKIVIWIGQKQHQLFLNYKVNQNYQIVLNSLIVFPALVYVLEELKYDGAIEKYEEKEWFIALENNFNKQNINFRDKIINEDAIEFAQKIMRLPITNAFEHLSMLNIDFTGDDYEN